MMAKKKTSDDEHVQSEDPQAPASTGPTVADVEAFGTHDGEPPILVGREGDTFRTVTLEGGGSGGGVYRVAEPLPQTLIAGGSRYMRSTEDTYIWQVP
jgi:hypothetical protein